MPCPYGIGSWVCCVKKAQLSQGDGGAPLVSTPLQWERGGGEVESYRRSPMYLVRSATRLE